MVTIKLVKGNNGSSKQVEQELGLTLTGVGDEVGGARDGLGHDADDALGETQGQGTRRHGALFHQRLERVVRQTAQRPQQAQSCQSKTNNQAHYQMKPEFVVDKPATAGLCSSLKAITLRMGKRYRRR